MRVLGCSSELCVHTKKSVFSLSILGMQLAHTRNISVCRKKYYENGSDLRNPVYSKKLLW